jgi:hypothetical protein
MQKKIFSGLFGLLIAMLMFVSCAKDTLVPAQSNINPNLIVSFKDTIQPIFTAGCMGSSLAPGMPTTVLHQETSSIQEPRWKVNFISKWNLVEGCQAIVQQTRLPWFLHGSSKVP